MDISFRRVRALFLGWSLLVGAAACADLELEIPSSEAPGTSSAIESGSENVPVSGASVTTEAVSSLEGEPGTSTGGMPGTSSELPGATPETSILPTPTGSASPGTTPATSTPVESTPVESSEPLAPSELSATRGTLVNSVALEWNAVEGATGYLVYRGVEGEAPTGDPAERLFDEAIPSTAWEDASAPPPEAPGPTDVEIDPSRSDGLRFTWGERPGSPGDPRRYAVRALFGEEEGPLSAVAEGWRGVPALVDWEVRLLSGEDATWTPLGSADARAYVDDAAEPWTLSLRDVEARAVEEGALLDFSVEPNSPPERRWAVRARTAEFGAGTPADVQGVRPLGEVDAFWERSLGSSAGWELLFSGTTGLDGEIGPGEIRTYRARAEAPGATASMSESVTVTGLLLAEGFPCASGEQCASGFCHPPTDTCLERRALLLDVQWLQGEGLSLRVQGNDFVEEVVPDGPDLVEVPGDFVAGDSFTVEIVEQPTGVVAERCDVKPGAGVILPGQDATVQVDCGQRPWLVSPHQGRLGLQVGETSIRVSALPPEAQVPGSTLVVTRSPTLNLSDPDQLSTALVIEDVALGDVVDGLHDGVNYHVALMGPGLSLSWTSSMTRPAQLFGSVNAALPNATRQSIWLIGGFTGFFHRVGNAGLVAADPASARHPLAFPSFNGAVNVAIRDGAGGWIVGGTFTRVGEVTRNRLARFDASGRLTEWNPNVVGPSAQVNALLRQGDTLFVGGRFLQVDGAPRSNLAAVDLETGTATDWVGNVNGAVQALASLGNVLYVGGNFSQAEDQERIRLAAFQRNTGALLPWAPSVEQGTINAMLAQPRSGRLLVSGALDARIGDQDIEGAPLLVMNATSGDISLPPFTVNGQILTMRSWGERLFLGGDFTQTSDGPRHGLAMADNSSLELAAGDPGIVRRTQSPALVRALSPSTDGGTLYVSGTFDEVGGEPRHNVAAFRLDDLGLSSWQPGIGRISLAASAEAIVALDEAVFIGGRIDGIASHVRYGFAELDRLSGDVSDADLNFQGTPQALIAAQAGVAWVAGHQSLEGVEAPTASLSMANVTRLPTTLAGTHGQIRSLAWTDDQIIAGADGGAYYLRRFDALTGEIVETIPTSPLSIRTLAADDDLVFYGTSTLAPYLSAINVADWRPLSWDPGLNGSVSAVLTDESWIYLGGSFTEAGGQPRTRLARFRKSDLLNGTGSGYTSWGPELNGSVVAMARHGNTLYLVGTFTQAGGEDRPRFAAIDIRNGELLETRIDFLSGVGVGAPTGVETDELGFWIHGSFTSVNDEQRLAIVRFLHDGTFLY